jgi:actin-related protein 5
LDSKLPILIDYGSYSTKAGWANSDNPDLVFRSVISKNKDLKNIYQPVLVGNQLKDFDYSKLNYRSPYENNLIIHFGIMESMNDYIFSELGIES